MNWKLIYFILLFVVFAGCAGQKPGLHQHREALSPKNDDLLPGTDSSIVKEAKKVFAGVDFEKREQADRMLTRAINTFSVAESLRSCIQSNPPAEKKFFQFYETWFNQFTNEAVRSKLREEYKPNRLQQISLAVLDSASQISYRAKLLNPFNLEIRSLLIKIYMKQGEITHQKSYYTRAAEELKRYLLFDKSNPYIYEKLGECYFALNYWEESYQAFREAERILKVNARFQLQADAAAETALDTNRLIYYLHRQGEARVRLYDSDGAIALLTQAMQLSNSQVAKQELQKILDWINWDDGNIRASEIRDEIRRLEANNNFRESRSQYLELLKILRSIRAKNEINWRIASIEYNILGRKNEALARMFHVIQSIQRNPVVDPLREIYLKDYAAMCYSVGLDYLNTNQMRLAYIYFHQASQIVWERQGDCFYQLAHLSRDNPAEGIRHCLRSLDFSDQISKSRIASLYELLAILYKRMGEFDNANKYFQNWVNLKNISKNEL